MARRIHFLTLWLHLGLNAQCSAQSTCFVESQYMLIGGSLVKLSRLLKAARFSASRSRSRARRRSQSIPSVSRTLRNEKIPLASSSKIHEASDPTLNK